VVAVLRELDQKVVHAGQDRGDKATHFAGWEDFSHAGRKRYGLCSLETGRIKTPTLSRDAGEGRRSERLEVAERQEVISRSTDMVTEEKGVVILGL
jgi:hypothetical protein